jgi:hypothetical protein
LRLPERPPPDPSAAPSAAENSITISRPRAAAAPLSASA